MSESQDHSPAKRQGGDNTIRVIGFDRAVVRFSPRVGFRRVALVK